MLFLFVSVILFSFLLCGAGCFFGRLLGYSSPRNPWIYFWLGFFIISTLSMFVSLFVPINLISLIVFFILGMAGLPFFYNECKKTIMQFDSFERKLFIFIAFGTVFVIACLGAYTSWTGAYDTDLYHAQTIRWYNEYGTSPGLGNLHARLAFNSSWLSMAALFDNGIWDNRSAWIMPALSLFGVILYCFHEIIFSRKNGIKIYALCILVYIALKVISGYADPSLYYDTPVHLINAVIILEAYYIFSDFNGNLSKKEVHDSAILLMLGTGAFMIKPIGAVSLLFSGLLTLYLIIRNKKQTVYSCVIVFTPALCAVLVWITKNLFLSGYPIYPLPIFAMPFDWTMLFGSANGNYIDVLAWARMPGPGYRQSLENGFLFWFRPWIISHMKSNDFLTLAVFPFICSVLLWFLVVRHAKMKKAIYFFIWTSFSILYWFISAPDLRFGDGFFWVWLGTALLFLVSDSSHINITGFLVNFWEKFNMGIKKRNLEKLLKYLTIFAIACCCVLLFPQVRNFIIEIGEKILGRELRDHDKWMKKQFKYSFFAIFCLVVFLLFLFRRTSMFFNKHKIEVTVSIVVLGGILFCAISTERNLFLTETIPSRPIKEYIVDTIPPFSVWIPLDPEDDRTGNSPLPSTPYTPDNLEMREPGNLGKGFRERQH